MYAVYLKFVEGFTPCKILTFCNSDFSIGKAHKSESASGYILAKHENNF